MVDNMNNGRVWRFLDSIFFIILVMMLSWTAYKEWLPKDTILWFVYIYFAFRILLTFLIEKKVFKFNFTIFIIIFLCFLSMFWSIAPSYTLKNSIILLIQTLIMIYMANLYKIKDILILISCSGTIITVSSFIVAILYPDMGLNMDKYYGAWEGIFTHKNNIAEVMALYILFEVFLIKVLEGKIKKSLIFFIILLQIILILLSQSTTGLFLLVFSLVFSQILIYLSSIKQTYLKASITSFFFLMFIFVSGILLIYSSKILGLFGKDLTFTGRDVIWDAANYLIGLKLIGGYGFKSTFIEGSFFYNYILSYLDFNITIGTLHNGFLELISYIGVLGMVFFLLALILYIVRSFMYMKLSSSKLKVLPLTFILYVLILNTQESALLGSEFALIWCIFVYFQTIFLLER